MAICAGALRNYLIEHDALPDRAAAGDGAGVDPHRRRGGAVDEPRVRARRRPADPPRAPAGARRCVPRGDGPGQAPVRAGPGRGAGRHPAVLVTGRGHRGDPAGQPAQAGRPHRRPGQRDHLQRPRTPPAALHAGLADAHVHPGVDDRRGHGPQHHGAQLPRRARVRADRLPRAGARPVAHDRPPRRRDRRARRRRRRRTVRRPRRRRSSARRRRRSRGSGRRRSGRQPSGRPRRRRRRRPHRGSGRVKKAAARSA